MLVPFIPDKQDRKAKNVDLALHPVEYADMKKVFKALRYQ